MLTSLEDVTLVQRFVFLSVDLANEAFLRCNQQKQENIEKV